MKKIISTLAFLTLLATPTLAQNIELDISYSSSTSNGVTTLSISFPNADAVLVRDALADWGGWTETVVCDSNLVAASICLEAELGEDIPNPITVGRASKIAFKDLLVRMVQRLKTKEWEAAASPRPVVVEKPE